jgi:nucleoside-diphosphate-sugar epimerase
MAGRGEALQGALVSLSLVTGATGFIGRNLCGALLESGLEIRILGRTKPDFAMDFYHWDLSQPLDAWALDGVDTVFHLAGKAHALSEIEQDEKEYFRMNTESTQALLDASKKMGVKTFVYFSSVKASGEIDGPMDELVVVEPNSPYGRSKWAAERLVLEGGYVPHPVVIRPSMVYGNTEKGNLPKMIHAIQAGSFPPLPMIHNKRSMVHVDDVVQAAMLAAVCTNSAGQTYIVTDGEAYSTRQMYEWICKALHKSTPAWYLPLFMLKLMAKVGDIIGSLRGSRFIFDSDVLQKLTGSAFYSPEKIERELGFKASRNLREALPEIIQYLGASR